MKGSQLFVMHLTLAKTAKRRDGVPRTTHAEMVEHALRMRKMYSKIVFVWVPISTQKTIASKGRYRIHARTVECMFRLMSVSTANAWRAIPEECVKWIDVHHVVRTPAVRMANANARKASQETVINA